MFEDFTTNSSGHAVPDVDISGISTEDLDDYARFIEEAISERYGPYYDRGHDARMAIGVGFEWLNCIFDLLGVPYGDQEARKPAMKGREGGPGSSKDFVTGRETTAAHRRRGRGDCAKLTYGRGAVGQNTVVLES